LLQVSLVNNKFMAMLGYSLSTTVRKEHGSTGDAHRSPYSDHWSPHVQLEFI